MSTIGIDAIAIAVPEGYVELAELAEARGVPPTKFTEGLGVTRMSVARQHEDPVSLAANAARRLIATAGIDPSGIGLCVVGTETAVDHSKPVAAYLHRLLGLPERCRVFEAKHACFGGTAGLLAAVDWIASGSARGRQALVVCTDVARYTLNTPGEPTQGAGAVAMLISQKPRLLALEPGISGSYAKDVNDFWRPLYTKEAVVDGHHSVQCYLDALTGAYSAFRDASREAGYHPDSLVRRCYHVPYGKMAKKAHRQAMQLEGKTEQQADASYAEQVAPSLRLPSQVGNIYTGSLYLALASLLDAEAGDLEGKRIGLFSYGSGCTAEYFAGRVQPGAGELVKQLKLSEPLEHRRKLTIPEYEAVRGRDDKADQLPVGELAATNGGIAFLGIDSDRRVYNA
jgi:hydroxymethylglutaryl-CoA synthase